MHLKVEGKIVTEFWVYILFLFLGGGGRKSYTQKVSLYLLTIYLAEDPVGIIIISQANSFQYNNLLIN